MNDMFDEMERVGRVGSEGMGARLRSEATKVKVLTASRKRRHRRIAAQGLAATAVLGAIGVGGWLWPASGFGDVDPASGTAWDGSMTGSSVGVAVPVPDLTGWPNTPGAGAEMPFCVGPYTPPAKQGLTIRDTSVRDLGIRLDTALGLVSIPAAGEPVVMSSDDYPVVDTKVSWAGDRELVVTGYAVLEFSDGTMRSFPMVGPSRDADVGYPVEDPFSSAVYDASTDRMTVSFSMSLWPYDCRLLGPDGEAFPAPVGPDSPSYDFYALYDGDYTLHVVLQVSDREGEPLATFVDADAVGGTAFRLEEPTAKWIALDQQYDDAIAILRQRLNSEGQALTTAPDRVGVRTATLDCQAAGALWSDEGPDLAVLDGGTLDLGFPSTVSRAQLAGTVTLGVDNPTGLNDGTAWYTGVQWLVLRQVTPDGVRDISLGVAAGFLTDPPDSTTVVETQLLFNVDPFNIGCDAASSIEPGEYEAVLVVAGVPPGFLYNRVDGHGPIEESWITLGTVTITE